MQTVGETTPGDEIATPIQRAYVAGLFESRGYFTVSNQAGRRPRLRLYIPEVQMDTAAWAIQAFGGSLQYIKARNNSKTIPVFSRSSLCWCLSGTALTRLLHILSEDNVVMDKKHIVEYALVLMNDPSSELAMTNFETARRDYNNRRSDNLQNFFNIMEERALLRTESAPRYRLPISRILGR